MSSTKLSRAVAIALLAISAPAAASQFTYDLYAGVLHSDNINLSTTRPTSESVFVPGVNFTWDQQGSDLRAHAFGNVEYRDYLGGRFKNQTAVQLASQALWTISPERLDFAVQDYAGIQPLDTLASDAPGNRQQTNVLAVGPVFHFRLTGTLRGQAELRYINSYAEKTKQFDSNRGQAALRVLKDVSPTTQVSLNYAVEKVDLYRDETDPNYSRQELFAHYVHKLAHVDVDLQLGTTRIDYDHRAAPNKSGPLVRASVDWRMTTQSTFTIGGRRQYSDAAQDMMLQPGATSVGPTYAINTGDTMVSPQVYLEREIDASYGYRGTRFTFSLSPYYRKLGYQGDTQYNQTGRGVNASVDYRLQPTLTLSAYASRENLRFNSLDRLDRTLLAGISLTSQRNDHWSWRAGVSHQRRRSSAFGQGYHETEIYLGVLYRR